MIKLLRSIQRFVLLSLLVAALLLTGIVKSKAQQPSPAVPTSLGGLQQAIQAILTANHVPGAGIALVNKDKVIWAGGVGKARVATNTPVTQDTMFRVGPITQTFVALAVLQLQEQKKLDLNAKLSTLAPTLPFKNSWAETNPITVAEVLENTAGFGNALPGEVYNISVEPPPTQYQVGVQFPLSLVARWAPGTRMSYSDPGYGVAGYLIWKATQFHFDQYIEQNILQPLGMTKSGFTLTDKIFAQLAQGYYGNPPRAFPYLNIYLRPAGDLKSSPAELAKLVQMFLNGGKAGKQQIVSAASIQRMEYPQTTLAAKAGLRNGYGFANGSILDGPVVQHGIGPASGGNVGGYLSSFGYMPNQGVGYVALINNGSGESALRSIDELLARYLVAGQNLPQPPSASLTPAQLKPYTGYYAYENSPDRYTAFRDVLLDGVHISLSGSQLYWKQGWFDPSHPLIATGNNQFRFAGQAAASMIFFRGPAGREILATATPGGFFGERRGEGWPLARFILIHLAILAILTSFAFAIWWVPRKFMGKMKEGDNLSLRAMPLLAGLSLLAAYLIVIWTPIWVIGTYNIVSVGVFLLTWLFAAFSVLGLILAWRTFRKPGNRLAYWYSLIVTIACCGLAIYMAYWHILGIQLWKT